MYKYKGLNDTIAAVATAAGQGGIGIIRLSGPDALSVAGKMFRSKSGRAVRDLKHASISYGWIVAVDAQGREDVIDEVLLTVMRAPKSYTCEDVVEVQGHGGIVPLRTILNLAVGYGARLAEPGEFTKRAFLNGRLDLTQAEAVLDIVQTRTDSFLKVISHQLKGDLSTKLEVIREILMEIYTELEAVVNFPEDDIDGPGRQRWERNLESARVRVDDLLATADHGKILRDGIRIVICGKPNVGKSSLLNALLRQPRAIVSDIAGTTRDAIEEYASIRGIPLQLVDTAGILEPRDLIEEEAVKRSRSHIASADVVLFVVDVSRPLDQEDERIMENLQGLPVLAAFNKCDLPARIDRERIMRIFKDRPTVDVSAASGEGLKKLEDRIIACALHAGSAQTHGVMINNARHIEALKKCREVLSEALTDARKNLSPEFVSEHVKSAVYHLDNITGRDIDVDLIDQIFSRFCIGK